MPRQIPHYEIVGGQAGRQRIDPDALAGELVAKIGPRRFAELYPELAHLVGVASRALQSAQADPGATDTGEV